MNSFYFNPVLDELFVSLNNKEIPYFLVRDYDSVESVLRSEDLDVVISEEYKKTAVNLILSLGWKTPTYNLNLYGHQQFFKWYDGAVLKLDIIFGLYFGNGLYSITNDSEMFRHTGKLGCANVPSSYDGLLIHLCHIVYDKKSVSEKNRRFLRVLANNLHDSDMSEYINDLLEGNNDLPVIKKLQHVLLATKVVRRHSSLYVNSLWFCKKFVAHFVHKKSISVAVIGVDGSGKSTSVEAVKEFYGNDVTTQYMGFRLFQTRIARAWYKSNKRIPIIGFIVDCLVLPYEMRCRYHQAEKQGKKIILFDRYPWEIYDNSAGLARKINFVLFKLCFKKPDGLVYLYCPVETSFSRKDDIVDKELFRLMKDNFDAHYKKYPNALVMDTSVTDKETVRIKTIEYVSVLERVI